MKKKKILFKLFTVLLSLSILVPEFSTIISASPPVRSQVEPTPTLVHEAPAAIEEPLVVDGSQMKGIDASKVSNTSSIGPLETQEERIKKIKAKYVDSNKQQDKSSKLGTEPSLSKEKIKKLMIEGASVEDIYEIAFLSAESELEPSELWLKKQKDQRTWDELRQLIKEEKKGQKINEKKGVNNVVYGTKEDIVLDLNLDSEDTTVSDSVYEEFTSKLGVDRAIATMSALDYNVNSVISDFNMEVINQTHKPQFSDLDPSSEIIDPMSGSLTWKDTQISLPGRDGLDLNIGIMYNSNLASVNEPSTREINYNINKYDLGTGWGFRFPSLAYNYDAGAFYYHDGEGSIYRVVRSSENALEDYTHLQGYKGKDKRIVFENSTMYVEYKDKKREYYGGLNNSLTAIVDRYGNTITFNYATDSAPYQDRLLSITDSLGRKVLFQYDTVDNRPLNEGEQRVSENITVSVMEVDGTESEKVTYTRKRVGRYAPTIIYRGLVYSSWMSIPILESITDQSGSQTTFNYVKENYLYNLESKTLDPLHVTDSVPYFNLTTVNYPHARTKYEYDLKLRN